MEQTVESEKRFEAIREKLSSFSRRDIAFLVIKYPLLYRGICLILAVIGYLFLVMMPIMVIVWPYQMVMLLQQGGLAQNWPVFMSMLVALVISVVVTYTLYKLKFELPAGPELKRDKYALLFTTIDDIRQYYQTPFLRIDRVIISEKFEVKIVRTPQYSLPVKFTHSLMIGLPVLQAMGQDDIRAMLARAMSRSALQHGHVDSWLSILDEIWRQYSVAAGKLGIIAWPVYGFFKVYSFLYHKIACHLQRSEWLRSEHDVLAIINDQDAMQSIIRDALIERFIEGHYWKKIQTVAAESRTCDLSPYQRMINVVSKFTASDQYQMALDSAWQKQDDPLSCRPSLWMRLHNLGFEKIQRPAIVKTTAAQYYLGQQSVAITRLMDTQWQLRCKRSLKV